MLKKLKYIAYLLFFVNNITANNHKILTIFGSYDPLLFSWLEPWTPFTDEKHTLQTSVIIDQNNKIKYKKDNDSIYYRTKGKLETADIIPQSFFLAKLDHSFDEIADNIYAGFSLAYLNSHITGKKDSILSFYKTEGIGAGGYIQWQDEEETDYNIFIKLSVLCLAQTINCKVLHNKLVSHTPVIYQLIESPISLAGLAILQAGVKIGFLEISPFVAYNQSAPITLNFNKVTSSQKILNNLYFGVSIGFIFK